MLVKEAVARRTVATFLQLSKTAGIPLSAVSLAVHRPVFYVPPLYVGASLPDVIRLPLYGRFHP